MNYESFNEIHFSYREMKLTVEAIQGNKEKIESIFQGIKDVVLLGCGSSYWASLSVARSFAAHTNYRVHVLKAAEVVMAEKEYVKNYENLLVLIPSRSGESKELLEAVEMFKTAYPDMKLVTVTEFEENTLKNKSDLNISIPFVEEISICQTRSFNCLYTALMCIVSIISNSNVLQHFENYLMQAPKYYEEMDRKISQLVFESENPNIVVLSSGIQYGAAIEGAYIIMEMAQYRTNYFQTLEYRHGPVVTADQNTLAFMIATKPENLERELQMGKEITQQKAKLILCGCTTELDEADLNFTIDPFCEEVRGVYATSILQHLAYYLALKLKRNPDKPGDLVKYITY